jgi:hypothetical protein
VRALLPLCALGALVAVSASCSSKTANGSIALITGGETDVFSRAPAPTTIAVDAIDLSGASTSLLRAPLVPGATVDLADMSFNAIASLRVTGLDDTGTVRVWGTSLAVQLGALDGATLSLFVQRTGELARMPSPFTDGRQAPLLAAAGGRYILVAGGADPALATSTLIYDFATWSPLVSPPTLPRAPRSLALATLVALLVDDAGATWFDLTSSTDAVATVPSGGTFADVAGGETIVAPDGTAYIVGGTRAEGPTSRVLRVSPTGALTFVTLATPRAGAAAAWVDERGLVIAGGSATGPGVEIVGATATAAVPLAYPADATTGAGLARLDAGHALLVGGVAAGADAGLRTLDQACAAACAIAPGVPLPVKLTHTAVLDDPGGLLAIGDDETGATHVLRVDAKGALPIPVKLPRQRARAVRTPTGSIAIVGGDPTIESFAF